VTDTVVAPRAVPLTMRLRPVPVEPAAGEVIWTGERSGLAAWAPVGGLEANATSRAAKTVSALRVVVGRIRTPQLCGLATQPELQCGPGGGRMPSAGTSSRKARPAAWCSESSTTPPRKPHRAHRVDGGADRGRGLAVLVVCRGFGDPFEGGLPRATLSRISSPGLVQTKGSGLSLQWEPQQSIRRFGPGPRSEATHP
jgi:hypothetical protein